MKEKLFSLLGKYVSIRCYLPSIIFSVDGDLTYNFHTERFSVSAKDSRIFFSLEDVTTDNDFNGNVIRLRSCN